MANTASQPSGLAHLVNIHSNTGLRPIEVPNDRPALAPDWTEAEDELLADMIERKMTYKEMTKYLKSRTQGTIKDHAWKLRNRGLIRHSNSMWTKKTKEKLRALYKQGYTRKEMADMLGCTRGQLSGCLDRMRARGHL